MALLSESWPVREFTLLLIRVLSRTQPGGSRPSLHVSGMEIPVWMADGCSSLGATPPALSSLPSSFQTPAGLGGKLLLSCWPSSPFCVRSSLHTSRRTARGWLAEPDK